MNVFLLPTPLVSTALEEVHVVAVLVGAFHGRFGVGRHLLQLVAAAREVRAFVRQVQKVPVKKPQSTQQE